MVSSVDRQTSSYAQTALSPPTSPSAERRLASAPDLAVGVRAGSGRRARRLFVCPAHELREETQVPDILLEALVDPVDLPVRDVRQRREGRGSRSEDACDARLDRVPAHSEVLCVDMDEVPSVGRLEIRVQVSNLQALELRAVLGHQPA